ncbi:MAG: hypothetical protein M1457_00510, partial [bacterium]|nr:hypothetical protein [bacterium]
MCVLTAALGARPAAAQSEGSRIDKVEITGLVSYKPAEVLARLKTKAGQAYNSVDVRDDLTELSRIMRTASVSTQPSPQGGVIVTFSVSEFPRFRKLQVIGNEKLKTDRIETLAGLKPGAVLDEKAQTSLQKALINEYKALGLPQAKVTLNLIPVTPEPGKAPQFPEADLQVIVNEGRQVLVKDVIIEGNEAFSALRLKAMMDTKGSWGFIKNYYDEATFEGDLDRLRTFYTTMHGYFDARIERGVFGEQKIGNKSVISPVVRISEGERYKFGKAEVRGGRLFSQTELLAPFKSLEGQLFDGRKFARALDQLGQLYLNHGLLTTEIVPKYDYDEKNRLLNMSIDITEKNRIYVNKIKLVRPGYEIEEGKTAFGRWYERFSPPVKDEVILREALLKPGEIYNKSLETETLRRLAAMGVFEQGPSSETGQEALRAYNEPTGEAGLHNFVIEAKDATTGAISGGVGFGDASGAFLFGQFTERNVHGLADVFSLQIMLGTRESSASVSYLDRHIGDANDSLLSRLYYENLSRPGYRASIGGVSSEWGHPLADSDWTRYLRGRLEVVSLTSGEPDQARRQRYRRGSGPDLPGRRGAPALRTGYSLPLWRAGARGLPSVLRRGSGLRRRTSRPAGSLARPVSPAERPADLARGRQRRPDALQRRRGSHPRALLPGRRHRPARLRLSRRRLSRPQERRRSDRRRGQDSRQERVALSHLRTSFGRGVRRRRHVGQEPRELADAARLRRYGPAAEPAAGSGCPRPGRAADN